MVLKHINFYQKAKLFTLLVFIGALVAGCANRGNRFNPISYFPVQKGNTWLFNGGIYKMQITDIAEADGEKLVTFSYTDTSDIVLWRETYRLRKNQLYWQTFTPNTPVLPEVSFDPPLPFAPFSAKEGQTLVLESIETQSDTVKSTTQIIAEYEVLAVEDVKVPAGTFLNCIKLKINIQYPQSVRQPYFIGEQYWWFAPTIGPVKYDLPSAVGELVKADFGRNRLSNLP